jgi:hypothetical protein
MSSLGFSNKDVNIFRDSLFYSGRNSVDAFLEHRQEFIDLGKASIAKALIPFENQATLFSTGNSWYKYFFNLLNTSFDAFPQNHVSIVTYNYDRSLEHYLFTALKNSYGKEDSECAKALGAIPIIHLHGQLGYLPWQSDSNVRAYDLNATVDAVAVSSKHIKIIHESIEHDEEFSEANKLLQNAMAIYFIGFGYDITNLKRLKMPPQNGRDIQGTGFGLKRRELEAVQHNFQEAFGINFSISPEHIDAYRFHREFAIFR